MHKALEHCEAGRSIGPRHPIVCGIDLPGCTIAISLIAMVRPSTELWIYLVVIAAQFAVSIVYHWARNNETLRKLDHLMIVFTIAATYVPYWSAYLSTKEMLLRFGIWGVLVVAVMLLKWFRFQWRVAGGIAYLLLALCGLLVSFSEMQMWLPASGFRMFLVGAALYLLQFGIYAAKWPDPYPGFVGFREFQHIVLLAATIIHMGVATTYVG